MLHIRPVSDLRNKFPKIEKTVLQNREPVYLTKNGYGSMALLSLKQYAALTDDVELALDKTDKAAELPNACYSGSEVLSRVREHIRGWKAL